MIEAAIAWKHSAVNTLIGLYMLFVGGLYIRTGMSVGSKLKQLQQSLQSRDVRSFPLHCRTRGEWTEGGCFFIFLCFRPVHHRITQAIESAFKKADVDGNGTLDVKELMQIMATLGSTMDMKEAETCLAVLDVDNSGSVSLDEFLTFMERHDGNVMF